MKLKYLIPLLSLAVIVSSCESAFDTKAIGDFEDGDVWRIPDLAEGTLLTVYEAIPAQFDTYNGNFLDVATDNAVTSSFSSDIYKLSQAGITSKDNPLGGWSNGYTQLQTIHMFMERGLGDEVVYDKTSEELDRDIKNRLRGECYFLRAWWHFYLLQRYGGRADDGEALGIPLTDHYITDEEAADISSFGRATYGECVDNIIEDLDSAIAILPVKYSGTSTATGLTNIGRATSLSAKVLKSRVALYGASPAYRSSAVISINGMGDFTVIDEDAYLDNWKYAAAVADTILRGGNFDKFNALTFKLLADNTGATPDDFVLRKYYQANGIESRHFPPYYFGKAQTQPSQNLVDAFPSKTGYPITDSRSGYDPQNPYAMPRDTRFDMTLYWHGKVFATSSGSIDISEGGKDSPTFDNKASRTGYYLAKFLSRKDNVLTPNAQITAPHYTPILRKAEVFFNYAEASNEAYGPNGKGQGCKWTAYEVMKMIRAAYGIVDETYLAEQAVDRDSFRKLIQNERRIELAFENQRFFDLRRCLLPLDSPVRGVKVTRSEDSTVYSYEEVETRPFDDVKYYYMPIPYSEMQKNSAMVNNFGW
ncbi:MAG: RagB/SusD family nutrient uptake outer membrane protein [Candidatus Cryptobacteroides sp.]